MLLVLQVVVFLMGFISLTLSINYMMFFLRVEKKVGRSMVFLMLEQIVSAVGTLMFSMNSLWLAFGGHPGTAWNTMDPLIAISIRMAMFGAMIHSNIHLTLSIKHVLAQVGATEKED